VNLVERASVLGHKGANGTQTAETRRGIAGEITSLLEQLVAISQTNIEGRYVFSGDSDQQAPFTLDWSQTYPVSTYQGTAATRQAMHPSGTRFAVSRSADQIFDDQANGKSVFVAVDALRVALLNNDEPAMEAALVSLSAAGSHLNEQLAFYGSVQNRVTDSVASAHKLETRSKIALSGIEDADVAAAIVELTETKFQQEAALSSKGQMPRTSLFDYLG
jgi:flagellar hook-associated protein 3 FlgL